MHMILCVISCTTYYSTLHKTLWLSNLKGLALRLYCGIEKQPSQINVQRSRHNPLDLHYLRSCCPHKPPHVSRLARNKDILHHVLSRRYSATDRIRERPIRATRIAIVVDSATEGKIRAYHWYTSLSAETIYQDCVFACTGDRSVERGKYPAE